MSRPLLLLLAVLAIGVLILVVIGVARRLLSAWRRPADYRVVESLLTASELAFFLVLREAVGSDYQILMKVRLADVLEVTHERGSKAWQPAWNRIRSKHLDYLLCDPETLAPRLAIELDDRSHERTERRERDEFLNDAMAEAGLPILRQRVSRDYDADALRRELDRQLARGRA